jgi:hypothetical protein
MADRQHRRAAHRSPTEARCGLRLVQ